MSHEIDSVTRHDVGFRTELKSCAQSESPTEHTFSSHPQSQVIPILSCRATNAQQPQPRLISLRSDSKFNILNLKHFIPTHISAFVLRHATLEEILLAT